jgi:hypothetical protein
MTAGWRAGLALAALTCVAGCEMLTSPLGDLELRVATDADTIVAGERIRVTIVVRNGGWIPIAFSGSGSCTIGMETIYPDGSVSGRSSVCTDDLRIWRLDPGDSIAVPRVWGPPFTRSALFGPAADEAIRPGSYGLRPYLDAAEGARTGPTTRIEVLPSARVELVHSYPALEALDLVVGGRHAVTGAAYGSPPRGGYVPAGRQLVEIRPAGAAPIASGVFEFAPGKRYTFAVRVRETRPEPWLITDPDTATGPSWTRLRLIHLALGAPSFGVQAVAPGGSDPLQGMPPLSYGVAWPYVLSEPGWWRIAAVGGTGADTLAWWTVRLLRGQVRTLVVLSGSAGGLLGLLLDP